MKSNDIEHLQINVKYHNENSNLILQEKENSEKLDFNTKSYKRQMGNLYCFYFVNGEPLIVIGPHWPFFLGLFSVDIIIVLILFNFLWNKLNFFLLILGIILSIVQLLSFLATALINPGLPKLDYERMSLSEEYRNIRKCKDCKMWINTEKKTYHCYDCGICVEGYDHHCPWTSKCIGGQNLIFFYAFIALTMMLFGFLIISVSLISPQKFN